MKTKSGASLCSLNNISLVYVYIVLTMGVTNTCFSQLPGGSEEETDNDNEQHGWVSSVHKKHQH